MPYKKDEHQLIVKFSICKKLIIIFTLVIAVFDALGAVITSYAMLVQNGGTVLEDSQHPEYNFKKMTDTGITDLPDGRI